VRSAIRCRVIALPKLSASHATMTTSHSGATLDSRGHDPSTSTMLGATTWNEIAATTSISTRGALMWRYHRSRLGSVVLTSSGPRRVSGHPSVYHGVAGEAMMGR
jgi:hypothetical protein